MTYPVPTLAGFEEKKSKEKATVSLSELGDELIVMIPDSANVPPEDTVYATFGDEEEIYESRSNEVPAGRFIEDTEMFEALKSLKVRIGKDKLEAYVGKEVELRYRSSGESNMVRSSAPLTLSIES